MTKNNGHNKGNGKGNGTLALSLGEIQGNLRQLLDSNLTPEQRYSIRAAIETMDFLRTLSPGLKKAVGEHRRGCAAGNGTSAVRVEGHSV